jgi:F0F1-type ATP synthase membrane subunit b/b'
MVKMLNILFFVIGFLICWVITKKPIQIKVHHVQETVQNKISDAEMRALEDAMLKEKPEEDKKFEDFDSRFGDIMREVNETMGGSDR